MGGFAKTMYNALLGWLRGITAWVWQSAGDGEQLVSEASGSWLRWLADNWLPLVIILCAAGVLIDVIVYIIRWQPYRVWLRFLRALTGKDKPSEQEAAADTGSQWVYADGTTVSQTEIRGGAAWDVTARHGAADDRLAAPVRPVKRVMPARVRKAPDGSEQYILPTEQDGARSYHQPVYPPQWHGAAQHPSDSHDHRGGNQ